ncbi:MAG: hypothetical protein JW797_08275 [Bradymonadales bacterium]|nr:hypothetical protein [Bradymonadales bacterium]
MSERIWPDGIERLLTRLGDEQAVADLVGLVFDFCIDQPIGRYLSPGQMLEALDRILTPEIVERALQAHLRPFLDRERERAAARGDRVEEWLTETAQKELRRLVGRPIRLRRSFLEQLVQQEAVRHMLRSIIEEALGRFVDSLKPDRKGSLLAALGRGAAGVASTMTRGLLGKLGSQLEAALSRAANSFIESSMDLMLRHTVDLLSSPEMAQRLGEMSQTGFDGAMELKVEQIFVALHRMPTEKILALVPELVTHNLDRQEVRQAILEELAAMLEVEGHRSVRELLVESKSVDYWRGEAIRLVTPLVVQFTGEEPLARWLEDNLLKSQDNEPGV